MARPAQLIKCTVQRSRSKLCEPLLFLSISWVLLGAISAQESAAEPEFSIFALFTQGLSPSAFVVRVVTLIFAVVVVSRLLGWVTQAGIGGDQILFELVCYLVPLILLINLLLTFIPVDTLTKGLRAGNRVNITPSIGPIDYKDNSNELAVLVILLVGTYLAAFSYPGLLLFYGVKRTWKDRDIKLPALRRFTSLVVCLVVIPLCAAGGAVLEIWNAVRNTRNNPPYVLRAAGKAEVLQESVGPRSEARYRFVTIVNNVQSKPIYLTRTTCSLEAANLFYKDLTVSAWSAHDDPILLVRAKEQGWIQFDVTQLGLNDPFSEWILPLTCKFDGKDDLQFLTFSSIGSPKSAPSGIPPDSGLTDPTMAVPSSPAPLPPKH